MHQIVKQFNLDLTCDVIDTPRPVILGFHRQIFQIYLVPFELWKSDQQFLSLRGRGTKIALPPVSRATEIPVRRGLMVSLQDIKTRATRSLGTVP